MDSVTLQVDIARLLSRCEAMTTDTQATLSPKFATFVRAVSEKMDQLAACTTNKPKAEVLDEYRQKVEHLKSLVDLDRLMTPLGPTMAQRRLEQPSKRPSDERAKEAEAELRLRTRVAGAMRAELLGENQASSSAASTAGATPATSTSTTTTEEAVLQARQELLTGVSSPRLTLAHDAAGAEEMLRMHRNMQEKLLEDWARLADVLKHNSRATSDILKRDDQVLDDAHTVIESNLDKLQHETGRLKDFSQVVKSGTWSIWTITAIVMLVFMFMIMFILVVPKK